MNKYEWGSPIETTDKPSSSKRIKEKSPTYRPPKTIGACADRLYELKELKSEAQKAVDKIEEERKALERHVIETLPKSAALGVAGKVARVTVVTKQVPQVKDYEPFYAFIKKNNRFDLLQKRLSEGAIKEIWDQGKTVPGVEAFTAVTISLTKN